METKVFERTFTFDLPHLIRMFGYEHGHDTTLPTTHHKRNNMASSTTSNLPPNIGWIGLGLMGLPMATNLLNKMDKSTTFYVFDVMDESVKKFVEAGEGRVKACASSKFVADKSVREQNFSILWKQHLWKVTNSHICLNRI